MEGEYCLLTETIAYRIRITNSADFTDSEIITSYIPSEEGWKKFMPVHNNNHNY